MIGDARAADGLSASYTRIRDNFGDVRNAKTTGRDTADGARVGRQGADQSADHRGPTLLISRLPDVVMVQFKRFSHDSFWRGASKWFKFDDARHVPRFFVCA